METKKIIQFVAKFKLILKFIWNVEPNDWRHSALCSSNICLIKANKVLLINQTNNYLSALTEAHLVIIYLITKARIWLIITWKTRIWTKLIEKIEKNFKVKNNKKYFKRRHFDWNSISSIIAVDHFTSLNLS